MKAIDNYFCKWLKCKMCIKARFLIKNLDILLSCLAVSPVFSIFLYLCYISKPLKIRGHSRSKPVCPIKLQSLN